MTPNSLPQLTAKVQSLAAPGSPFELERREHTTRGLHGGPRGVRSLQDRLTHLDLFSGIGGFALAAKEAGFRTVAFAEIDTHAIRVLKRHWPDVPNLGDVRRADWKSVGTVDLLTGGFPCQPFSVAGNRLGADDNRHLWPAMRDAIAALRPTWVVGENVPGLISLGLDDVLTDLEQRGYSAQSFVVPACTVDAKHRRDRLWIVAHTYRDGRGGLLREAGCGTHGPEQRADAHGQDSGDGRTRAPHMADSDSAGCERAGSPQPAGRRRDSESARQCTDVADASSTGRQEQHTATLADGPGHLARCLVAEWGPWATEPGVCRVADGIPNRVDRVRALGNAIVPQVAFRFLDAIAAIEFEGAAADARGGSAGERVSGKAGLSRAPMENVEAHR